MSEPPSDRVRARNTAGILLFIIGCLLSSVRLIQTSPNAAHLQADDIARRAEHRFSALKSQLPASGVIGYIGESGNAGTEDYYLAQYALAPLVVERSKSHGLVVVSISTLPPKPDTEGLQFVKDFGNGVRLFSNKDAK
jgi:hypothetical protein